MNNVMNDMILYENSLRFIEMRKKQNTFMTGSIDQKRKDAEAFFDASYIGKKLTQNDGVVRKIPDLVPDGFGGISLSMQLYTGVDHSVQQKRLKNLNQFCDDLDVESFDDSYII